MGRRGAALLLALLGLLVLPAGASARLTYGVVSQDGAVPEASDLELMPSAGISSIRLLAHWGTAEPSPGQYDWSTLDAMVRETTNRGIEPLLFLYGTPEWAARMDGRDCTADECSVYPPSSPATRAAFADFAAALVRRYGPGGDFFTAPVATTPPASRAVSDGALASQLGPSIDPCPVPVICPPPPPPPPPPSPPPPPTEPPCGCTEPHPIVTWQIWNEQNSPKYFAPKVSVDRYAAMLSVAGAAIKAEDPSAEVILGGMWGPASASRVVLPLKPYLSRLYRHKGVRSSFDSLALHPYASSAAGSVAQLEVAHKAIRRAHDRGASVWITELGWAAGGPRHNPFVKGKRGQAELLGQALAAIRRRQRSFHIEGVFWYSWRDKPGGEAICEWCGHAGLRSKSGFPKPAWKAFTRAARR